MIRARLDNWCEKGILLLVLAIVMFGPLATGAVRPLEFLIIQGLTMGALVLWVFRFWLNPGHRLFWPPICWAVIAFTIYAIVRYQEADIEYAARQEWIRILVYAFLFFIILNGLARQESTQILSYAVIFLGMAISLYAVYQFATDSSYVWHFIKPAQYQKRGSGTYICPNHLAAFLEMVLPMALTLMLIGRIGPLLRVVFGYASLVILAGIAVTMSRGGWIAAGLSLSVLLLLFIRKPAYRIPSLVVLIVVTAGVCLFYSNTYVTQKRVQGLLNPQIPVTSMGGRLWLWKPALEMWKDHIWLGVGPGQYDYRFSAYRPVELQNRPGYAHNDYLQTLGEWGLTGMTIIAGALGMLFAGVFRTSKFVRRQGSDLSLNPGNRAAFVFGASLGLLAILVHSFTDFNMHIPANAILTIGLMALLSSHLRFATERFWIGTGLIGTILATALGLGGLIYLGDQGWQHAREYVWLQRAASEKSYTLTRLDALKRAAAIEPMNFETVHEIGETFRQMSWQGDEDYPMLAQEAIQWFQRAARLNPYDPYNSMRIGMCLDWLGRHEEAAPYFEQALKRDPNNYYVLAHQGWHFVQTGDYRAAKRWFERSLEVLNQWHNPIAWTYLEIVNRKLKEPPAAASSDGRFTR